MRWSRSALGTSASDECRQVVTGRELHVQTQKHWIGILKRTVNCRSQSVAGGELYQSVSDCGHFATTWDCMMTHASINPIASQACAEHCCHRLRPRPMQLWTHNRCSLGLQGSKGNMPSAASAA